MSRWEIGGAARHALTACALLVCQSACETFTTAEEPSERGDAEQDGGAGPDESGTSDPRDDAESADESESEADSEGGDSETDGPSGSSETATEGDEPEASSSDSTGDEPDPVPPMVTVPVGSMNAPSVTPPLMLPSVVPPPPANADSAFGTECQVNADCAEGMLCLTQEGDAWLGGGAPGGYCSVECSADTTICAQLDPASACVALADSGAYCMQTCLSGDEGAKCHQRPDVVCETDVGTDSSGASVGICRPLCRGDVDCGGRQCDLGTGACFDAVTGDPVGAPCDPSAATNACASRLCLGAANGNGVCTGLCNLSQFGCGTPELEGEPGSAICLDPVAAEGAPWELGYCMQSCSCDEQCLDPSSWCLVTPLEVQAAGLPGVCVDRSSDFSELEAEGYVVGRSCDSPAQGSTVAGGACLADIDCLPGMFCMLSDSEFFSYRESAGTIPGGICTARCETDTSSCSSFGPLALCIVESGAEGAADDLGYCLEACQPADGREKCGASLDQVCEPFEDREFGACIPWCLDDAGCPEGLFCDPTDGLCRAEPAPGSAIGALCTTDEECSGSYCLRPEAGAAEGICSARCSFLGAVAGCGVTANSDTPAAALCYPYLADSGPNDPGVCLPTCDLDADCQLEGFVCEALTEEVQAQLGHAGLCLPATDSAAP